MKTLLVVPDFLSHYLPFSALGGALQARGHEVVVATGPGLAARVAADGFRLRRLVLGPGSNSGLVRPREQQAAERASLERFFEATRDGAEATLRYQAGARRRDLLWQPEAVTAALAAILEDEQPDVVVADQISFGTSLALRALDHPHVSLVVGHPSALPVGAEVFGVPPRWPPGLAPDPARLAALTRVCRGVERRFTAAFNTALGRLAPGAEPVANAFRVTSPLLTLVNYPGELARGRPGGCVGSLVRRETLDDELIEAVDRLPRPRVYAALGTFLSARADVLARIAEAVDRAGASLVLASGVTAPAALPRARYQMVRRTLPQAAVLSHCDAVVCHGGNGTVTEALTAGLPLLAAPFASDQFAAAADLVEGGLGDAFDPNRAGAAEIARRLRGILDGRAAALAARAGRSLRTAPGPERAAALVERGALRRPAGAMSR